MDDSGTSQFGRVRRRNRDLDWDAGVPRRAAPAPAPAPEEPVPGLPPRRPPLPLLDGVSPLTAAEIETDLAAIRAQVPDEWRFADEPDEAWYRTSAIAAKRRRRMWRRQRALEEMRQNAPPSAPQVRAATEQSRAGVAALEKQLELLDAAYFGQRTRYMFLLDALAQEQQESRQALAALQASAGRALGRVRADRQAADVMRDTLAELRRLRQENRTLRGEDADAGEEEEEEEEDDDDDEAQPMETDQTETETDDMPPARVDTVFGPGVVRHVRPDGVLQVELPWGTAYLQSSACTGGIECSHTASASARRRRRPPSVDTRWLVALGELRRMDGEEEAARARERPVLPFHTPADAAGPTRGAPLRLSEVSLRPDRVLAAHPDDLRWRPSALPTVEQWEQERGENYVMRADLMRAGVETRGLRQVLADQRRQISALTKKGLEMANALTRARQKVGEAQARASAAEAQLRKRARSDSPPPSSSSLSASASADDEVDDAASESSGSGASAAPEEASEKDEGEGEEAAEEEQEEPQRPPAKSRKTNGSTTARGARGRGSRAGRGRRRG